MIPLTSASAGITGDLTEAVNCMKKWKAILIVSAAVISMVVNIGFSVFYVFRYSSSIAERVLSDRKEADDYDEPEILDGGESFIGEEEETQEEKFQRIEREMQAVAEYLYTEGALAGVEVSDGIDTAFSPALDAKGWPYAVVYQEETEFDGGVKGYKMQKVTYEYMKDYGEQDEFVYEEEYCDESGNVVMDTQVLGFFLVDKDTLEVTDENTDQWH